MRQARRRFGRMESGALAFGGLATAIPACLLRMFSARQVSPVRSGRHRPQLGMRTGVRIELYFARGRKITWQLHPKRLPALLARNVGRDRRCSKLLSGV